MGNYLENVIEKLINDGLITESELEQRIAEEKAKSPVTDINIIGSVEATQMQMIDGLGQTVSMLMGKIIELEGKLND